MAIAHAEPGEVVDVSHPKEAGGERTAAIFKTRGLEVIRIVLPKGKKLPNHHAPGEITVHCLHGRTSFTARGRTQELRGGQILHLLPGDEHSLEALDDATLLLTIVLSKNAH